MQEQSRPLLVIDKNDDLMQKNRYHFVPCEIKQGNTKLENAQVSNYFESTIRSQPKASNPLQSELVAAIQGHQMVGTEQSGIEGMYSCLSYKKKGESESVLEIVAIQKIDKAVEWRKDIAWRKGEGHIANTLAYSQLLEKLHTPLESEQNS